MATKKQDQDNFQRKKNNTHPSFEGVSIKGEEDELKKLGLN